MSTTMVMTMATPSLPTHPPSSTCCPGCGYDLSAFDHTHAELLDAQAKIRDLESQVHILNAKATAAVDRWADYEDELTRLRAELSHNSHNHQQLQPQIPHPTTPTTPTTPTANPRVSFLQSGTSRLSALLSPRKSTPDLRTLDTSNRPATRNASNPIPPPSPSTEDLLEALIREKGLRKEAESQVATTSREVEELSAALFEQANEMVAEERRARAKLEERVGELERRDIEKRRRLEKLEGAMNRIQRVRMLLAEADEVESIHTDEDSEGHKSEQEHHDESLHSGHRTSHQSEKEKVNIKDWDHIEKPNEPVAT
ncbi:hypothetical protein AK830_g4948 [Neonectria ditissima]|uniref:GDP/GTP exchange factor Sec2 N-terminal domain-containing protein n=1 Tax=Neonectria ditissima TaxID=78410 RepID=A0A0P7BMQ1_9HYPO|nr:hypothetical protein AK830_g4948 [Neonectria ditissima]